MGSLAIIVTTILVSKAAAIEVTSSSDEFDTPSGGTVSLREAIRDASSGDTITFDASLSGETITLVHGQLEIDKDLTIDASSPSDGITIDANGEVTQHRVLKINEGGHTVSLHNLALINGRYYAKGGGVLNDGGTLTLSDCVVSNNATQHGASGNIPGGFGMDGGDSESGGGLYNAGGAVSLIRCDVSNNATGDGGTAGFGRFSTSGGSSGDGGGIYNAGGSLSMQQTVVSMNRTGFGASGTSSGSEFGTGGYAGSAGDGGGVYNDGGDVTVDECVIRDNATGNAGSGGSGTPNGGRGGSGGDGGGLYAKGGTFSMTGSTVSSNTTGSGGHGAYGADGRGIPGSGGSGGHGGWGGGLWCDDHADATISKSTIAGNSTGTAGQGGGGGTFDGSDGTYGRGGGLYSKSTLTLSDSTIAQNRVPNVGGGIYSHGALLLLRMTVTENAVLLSSGSGGGIFGSASGSLQLEGTIVAGNTASADSNIRGVINTMNDSLTTGDPQLAPLGLYGGTTATMPPLPDSPVIDAGPTSDPGGTDQRGAARFLDGALDIGAVEFQGRPDRALFWPLDFDQDGLAYGHEIAVGTDPFLADASSTLNAAFVPVSSTDEIAIRFGEAIAAAPLVAWVLKRSTNLVQYDEIYRFEDGVETFQSGVSSERSGGMIKVIDSMPPDPQAFYQFESVLR